MELAAQAAGPRAILLNYRRILGLATALYFVWWFAVEWLLPGSFNPLPSRLAVVGLGAGALVATYLPFPYRLPARQVFYFAAWLITLHYFYLFYYNAPDTNWVVGCYITIIAINLGFLTRASLLAYSVMVLVMSALLLFLVPALRETVFLPGLATILIQSNIALHSRLRAEREAISAAALAESVRARDEFISIASHELKTPITTLRLQLQMMERATKARGLSAYSTQELESIFDLIRRQTARLTQLVEAVLDVSRISSGKLELHRKPLDLAALVLDTTKTVLPGAQEKGEVRLSVQMPTPVFADDLRLSQVLENLLTNAVKYGGGAPIAVSLTQEQGRAVLSVADQGVGITPDFLPRLFSRFERAESSRNIAGLGLGLYIARQIVEAHGGRIDVETSPGMGSVFRVSLPL